MEGGILAAINTATVGKVFDGIDDSLAAWIEAQPVWFVATAPLAADGRAASLDSGSDRRGCDGAPLRGRSRSVSPAWSTSGVPPVRSC